MHQLECWLYNKGIVLEDMKSSKVLLRSDIMREKNYTNILFWTE